MIQYREHTMFLLPPNPQANREAQVPRLEGVMEIRRSGPA